MARYPNVTGRSPGYRYPISEGNQQPDGQLQTRTVGPGVTAFRQRDWGAKLRASHFAHYEVTYVACALLLGAILTVASNSAGRLAGVLKTSFDS
jgi:hypothetical protein